MRTSVNGLIEIAALEGVIPYKYLDSVKEPTFGIGQTKFDGTIDLDSLQYGVAYPLEFVFSSFMKGLIKYEEQTTKAMGPNTTQTEFDAGTSFHFNTGGI